MRQLLLTLVILGYFICSAGHSMAQNDSFVQIPGQAAWIDLNLDTLKAVMNVPYGTVLKNVGGLLITDDYEFSIRIDPASDQSAAIAAIKSEAQENDMDKFKRFIVSTDSSAFFEIYTAGSRMEFHFHIIRKINGRFYHFYNDRGAGRYSEENAADMLNSVLNMKAKT